jgi:hypothetical protein
MTRHCRCEWGTRFENVFMVAGAVLPVWKKIQEAITHCADERGGGGGRDETKEDGRVICCETTDTAERLIGVCIPACMGNYLVAHIRDDHDAADEKSDKSDY